MNYFNETLQLLFPVRHRRTALLPSMWPLV